MKLEELDITEEDIAEAGERIDTVVKRFRATAGPECYIWKLKYFDDFRLFKAMTSPQGAVLGCLIVTGLIPTKSYLTLLIIIGVITAFYIFCRIARGRILREKIWKKDYVSNEDILYLCRNRALGIIIHDEVEDGVCYTHRYLLKKKTEYLDMMRIAIGRKRKQEFLNQIKQQHSQVSLQPEPRKENEGQCHD
ncbi:hypothetical protein QPR65_22350 (plasmid) [Enterobacter hormaechei]|uniref:hypothetical protein n=1 Tax=Enterobacter hormaechei TaxID=158836 RepID=UPI0027D323E4|nr:hypothetical protein [Enterobacter hormaechei]WLZ51983.1 hypothetical protein QPR65_22350 [Enterobacter hormaechei]